MKSKYRKHLIFIDRLSDGQIEYSITDSKMDVRHVHNLISGETSVRQMLHNCKLMIDATLLPPLDEGYCGFGIQEGRGM